MGTQLNDLSESARSLLVKIGGGKSFMAHVSIWQELHDAGIVRWSKGQERDVLTAHGKRVRAELLAGRVSGPKEGE